jgi:GH15 family glucan-1,4-alpha-glucosidase
MGITSARELPEGSELQTRRSRARALRVEADRIGYRLCVVSMDVPSIGDYGLLGDTRTAALVSSRGSMDWMCFPRFDSPPLFGRLVGGGTGGSFDLEVDGIVETRRRYLGDSAVLETVWVTSHGRVVLTEGMVADTGSSLQPQALLVRTLSCRAGTVRGRVRFDPRLDWNRPPRRAERRHGRLVCTWGPIVATLATTPDLHPAPGVAHPFVLRAGESLTLALGLDHGQPAVLVDPEEAIGQLDLPEPETGPAVRRSLITLRLLTYAPSGAPVAAPTTSLPEVWGGDKNWDYRLAWVRDAGMGTSAFLGCGSVEEPRAFLWWMLHAGRRTRPRVRVAYDLLGGAGVPEVVRSELSGYRDARPVRVGNAAVDQFQLDAYAWMIDAGASYLTTTGELYSETWRAMRGYADVLAERWPEPDHGIWELRGARRHYVHSKVMAWTGLDRAVLVAERLGARRGRVRRWAAARDRIRRDVEQLGFDEDLGSYTQAYGSPELDAALLALAWSGIDRPDAARMRSTIAAVRRRLSAGGPLLYRFRPDGEGAFLPSSFWASRALAISGQLDEAREVFQRTCALATDLGLLAEEIDPTTKEHQGNFPQAFTHAALVEAAVELGRAEVRARGTLRGSFRT